MIIEERRALRKDTSEKLLMLIREEYKKNELDATSVDLLEGYLDVTEKYTRELEDAIAMEGGVAQNEERRDG